MKKFYRLVVLGWLVIIHVKGFSQLKQQCQTCFSSEVVSVTKTSAECARYELKVSREGACAHDLSHLTVAIPTCATVSNLTNDQNYPQVFGYDPTTGLTGFKIDNITNFGSSSLKSFQISFTLCSSTSDCEILSCWAPVAAYKAGTCFEIDTLKRNCSSNLQAHLEQTNATCFGTANGELKVVIDNGLAPFTYQWSIDSSNSSVNHLAAGNYSVNITDATGATLKLSATITQPEAITIVSSIADATCNGQSNGSIQLLASGGTGMTYHYLWNNGSTSSTLNSLSAGTYSVTVKDSLGCQKQASFVVKNRKQLTLSASNQLPSCNQSNGILTVNPIGGIEPYHYRWSNGDTTSSISNIPAGTYSVTVVDSAACSASASYFLRENNTLKISYNVTPTTCLDDGSGAIDISVSGGTQPYSYSWSNGAVTQDLQNLNAGPYTITVTDSLGCTASLRISVFKKTFQVNSEITQPRCAADTTGSITLSPVDGVAPFQYSWSTGSDSSSVAGLSDGIYKVTITDSTGCSKLMSFTILSPPPLKATHEITATACSEFSVDLTVTGGVSPYQYHWSTGAVTEDVTSLAPGNYNVVITDANACTSTQQITIDSTATFSCLIKPPSQTPTCSSSGNFIFTELQGVTYQWQLTSSDGSWQIQSGAASDTLVYMAGNSNTTALFTLSVTKNGCTQSCTYTLSACSSPNPGGGNNESCKDCFTSSILKKSDEGGCARYVVTISTDGNCRYDLSHFVIAIPCGEISDYSDSESWPLVLGKDPTTGLLGLKVDNVSGFGKIPRSFTLEFTVCYSLDCANKLRGWNPVVAYKAGQCIAYDTLSLPSSEAKVSAYPNPFYNSFYFDIDSGDDEITRIEIYDLFGKKICEADVSDSDRARKSTFKIDASSLEPNIYLYKIKTKRSAYYGRVMKVAK